LEGLSYSFIQKKRKIIYIKGFVKTLQTLHTLHKLKIQCDGFTGFSYSFVHKKEKIIVHIGVL